MSKTPITDKLSSDPAIDRRDVPTLVWREMERLELALAQALKERDEAQTVLRAWYEVFGTTQLTHARSRLESAESHLARMVNQCEEKT